MLFRSSNAMLLPVCLRYALPGAYDRFAQLGRAIGVAQAEEDDPSAAEHFLQAVESLVKELKTPTLAKYGVDKGTFFAAIDKMAHDAMESGSPQNTLRSVTEFVVKELYAELW